MLSTKLLYGYAVVSAQFAYNLEIKIIACRVAIPFSKTNNRQNKATKNFFSKFSRLQEN